MLYKNKITLKEIQEIIYPGKLTSKKFIDKLFSPLHTSSQDSFASLYIGTHKSTFMNGNYYQKANGEWVRYSIKNLRIWAEILCDENKDTFQKMLDALDKIYKEKNEDNPLNKNHRVFELIEKDLHDMPNAFVNYMNLCMQNDDYLKILLMMILWSIYGKDEIGNFEKIYNNNIEPQKNFINKSVRLLSYVKPCRPVFKGRDEFIEEMHKYFLAGNHFVFLKGMGGIGKSECAKQYAEKYKEQYDTIVFAECTDSIIDLINNNIVFSLTEPFISERINNSAGQTENDTEFYNRKLTQLKAIANKRILVIIDNLDRFDLEIENLIAIPFHMIITTRWNYAEMYPYNIKQLNEIEDMLVLKEIFSEYYGKDMSDNRTVEKLIIMFNGHTMAIELIAKQMKASNLTPEEMLNILNESNEDDLEEGFIMLNYDDKQHNISNHMQKLFNIASLNDEEKYIMMCLSLMPLLGINKRSFKEACGLRNYNFINRLIECSWINESNGKLFMHTLVKETVHLVCQPDFCKCRKFADGLIRVFPTIQIYYKNFVEKAECAEIAAHIYKTFPEPVSELYDLYEWIELIMNHCTQSNIPMQISKKLWNIYRKKFGDNHFRTARMLCRMGCVEKNFYTMDKAVELLEKGRETIINLKNRTEKETLYISDINIVISNTIIENYERFDEKSLDKVERLSQEIISIRSNFHGEIDPLYLSLVMPYYQLAWIEIYHHNYNKACDYIEKMTYESDKIDSDYINFFKEYLKAKLALGQGNLSEAIYYLVCAIKRYGDYFKEYDATSIHMNIELGEIYEKTGNIAEAVNQYKQVLKYIDKYIEKNKSFQNKKLYSDITDKIEKLESPIK